MVNGLDLTVSLTLIAHPFKRFFYIYEKKHDVKPGGKLISIFKPKLVGIKKKKKVPCERTAFFFFTRITN